jgi:hypothetical protein
MSKLEDANTKLNAKTPPKIKSGAKYPGIGWEIAAYIVRALFVLVPAITIMALKDSWLKTGLSLLATLLIVSLLIVFKDPLKKASGYAPGAVPFAIFITLALLFKAVSNAFLTIGVFGLLGCLITIPLHLKFLSYKEQEKSPELQALETITSLLR